jgi:hypothetical protein
MLKSVVAQLKVSRRDLRTGIVDHMTSCGGLCGPLSDERWVLVRLTGPDRCDCTVKTNRISFRQNFIVQLCPAMQKKSNVGF